MNVSTWFEIPVSDMDRAQRFYEKTFAVSLERSESMDMLSAIFPHTPGSNCGSLTLGEGYNPSPDGVVVYLAPADGVTKTLARAESAGGSVILSSTELPETDAGFIGLVMDSEGNKIGLHGQQ